MKFSLYGNTVQTKRTRLRPLAVSDIHDIARLHADHVTQKFSWIDGLYEPSEIREWIELEKSHFSSGYSIMAIESLKSAEFIGVCGLRHRPDLKNITDITYRIVPEKRNQGFATEVVGGLVKFSFNSLHIKQLFAEVHRNNYPSKRIMYRLGFEPVEREELNSMWLLFCKKSTLAEYHS